MSCILLLIVHVLYRMLELFYILECKFILKKYQDNCIIKEFPSTRKKTKTCALTLEKHKVWDYWAMLVGLPVFCLQPHHFSVQLLHLRKALGVLLDRNGLSLRISSHLYEMSPVRGMNCSPQGTIFLNYKALPGWLAWV